MIDHVILWNMSVGYPAKVNVSGERCARCGAGNVQTVSVGTAASTARDKADHAVSLPGFGFRRFQLDYAVSICAVVR